MKGNIRSSPHLRIALSLQNDKYTKAEMFKYKEVDYHLGLLNPIYGLLLKYEIFMLNYAGSGQQMK